MSNSTLNVDPRIIPLVRSLKEHPTDTMVNSSKRKKKKKQKKNQKKKTKINQKVFQGQKVLRNTIKRNLKNQKP